MRVYSGGDFPRLTRQNGQRSLLRNNTLSRQNAQRRLVRNRSLIRQKAQRNLFNPLNNTSMITFNNRTRRFNGPRRNLGMYYPNNQYSSNLTKSRLSGNVSTPYRKNSSLNSRLSKIFANISQNTNSLTNLLNKIDNLYYDNGISNYERNLLLRKAKYLFSNLNTQ